VGYDETSGEYSASYSSTRASYAVTKTATGISVRDSDGVTDTYTGIDRLKFSDMTVNLMIQPKAAAAPAAEVTRLIELYVAFQNRVPDADGLTYWIDQRMQGKSIDSIADVFYEASVDRAAFTGYSATMTNEQFVNIIYRNVLGRKEGGDAEGVAYWTGELASGHASKGSLVSTMLDSAHWLKGRDSPYAWSADLLDNKIAVARAFAVDWGLNFNTPEDSIAHGIEIVAAITPTDTSAAIRLIGVSDTSLV